jgi:protease YdgD
MPPYPRAGGGRRQAPSRHRRLPLAALALAVAAGPTGAGAADWRDAVGRINLAGFDWRQHCTGTLIAPRMVLTSGHCVYVSSRGRWARAAELHFLAGYDGGDYAAHLRAERVIRPQADAPGEAMTAKQAAGDWAVIVTTAPAPARIPRLPLARERSAERLAVAGYLRERRHALTVSENCQVVAGARAPGLIPHDCPMGPGASGGPLLERADGSYRVVGVNVGMRAAAGPPVGYAVPSATFAHRVAAAVRRTARWPRDTLSAASAQP